MVLKWGIIGAGKISQDFATSFKNLPISEHRLAAVASKTKKRAEEFAFKLSIPKAYDSYETLASDPNIDVVYVATLNTQHFEIVKLLLNHRKHVLCEKPMCPNYEQTEELLKIAKQKGLFFMEALWTRCQPAYDEIRKAIANGSIGEIFQVTVNFGQTANSDRVLKNEFAGGIVLDTGVYSLQLASLVFGRDTPYEITTEGYLNENSVDTSYTCIIKYPNKKAATLICSCRVNYINDAYIYGTKGFIKIHDPFWAPTQLTLHGKTMEFPLPKNDTGFYNYINSAKLHYEAKEVYRCIKKGLTESPLMPHADSLLFAKMRDTMRRQLGVTFHEGVSAPAEISKHSSVSAQTQFSEHASVSAPAQVPEQSSVSAPVQVPEQSSDSILNHCYPDGIFPVPAPGSYLESKMRAKFH